MSSEKTSAKMGTVDELRRRTRPCLVGGVLLAIAVVAACTGGEDATDAPSPDRPDGGSLGVVEVADGDAIQIRSLNAITGDVAWLGLANQRGVELAIADFGPVHGFDVHLGAGLDEFCSSDGGQAAAQHIVADVDVVGVIGTSCSVAATAAAPARFFHDGGRLIGRSSSRCAVSLRRTGGAQCGGRPRIPERGCHIAVSGA